MIIDDLTVVGGLSFVWERVAEVQDGRWTGLGLWLPQTGTHMLV